LPPSRARYLGDVWVASIDRTDKKIEVPATELPEVLHRVRGEVVKTIFSARCGLKDSYFYSTEDMVFVMINRSDAELLHKSIR